MPVGSLDILGHEQQLQLLRENRAATLLFIGPAGVGRRPAARWYAAFLNCQGDAALRPCGECGSCRAFIAGTHPDYRELAPRATTTTGRRSQKRELRIGQLVQREGEGDEEALAPWLERRPRFNYRVGVIDGANALTTAAANAFLKMLEEPPSYARIILIAPSRETVLPTVASRCAVIRFGAVDTSGLPDPGHFAHRLGLPGPLLERGEDEAGLQERAAAFVPATRGRLQEALEAADALAEAWQKSSDGPDPVDLLREAMRDLPGPVRSRGDDALLEAQDALASYAAPQLVLRVLALRLRSLQGLDG